ncbi:MAG: YkgJ family cysteine cluster protein [Gammaproteobacteria bacterium]|nr:YkgJ family cysteine cluster protein [Gammaproteobacteria bacterium]MYD76089.1 YkgJ family cysteine cluster protein [Gammaproteobacteria bacterium]MYJ52211.1 YkgJ family cysteine cluster protein [Gammaproteobacteria bacterium]
MADYINSPDACVTEMSLDDLKKIKNGAPFESPVNPVELTLDSEIRFHCHKGVSCFNACCRHVDITLTPYDILRLKRRMNMTSSEWVSRYTLPFPMDAHEMPGLKLATKPGSNECVFLRKEGCGVYEDRPAACRYYALGQMGVKRQGSDRVEDIFFLVREEHCKGHEEPRTLSVRDYLEEQGIGEYDEANREWRDIVLKKRSSGPTVGKPSSRSMQLFDMCSYDIDSFRRFFQSPGFSEIFDLGDEEKQSLLEDEDRLFNFACRFLKQILFAEMTIDVNPRGREKRLARRRERAATSKKPGT